MAASTPVVQWNACHARRIAVMISPPCVSARGYAGWRPAGGGHSRALGQTEESIVTRQFQIANSLLWASAIIASAACRAPLVLTLVLLPALAAGSWVLTVARARPRTCVPPPNGIG